eukprot:Awhi_evm1s10502
MVSKDLSCRVSTNSYYSCFQRGQRTSIRNNNGFVQSKKYSTDRIAVYKETKNGVQNRRSVIIGIRGSVFSAEDLKADKAIILNQWGSFESSARFQEAENIVTSLIEKKGGENVFLTGHSLGATIAVKLQKKYLPEQPTFVFRPAVGPMGKLTDNHNVIAVVSRFDVVSFLSSWIAPNIEVHNDGWEDAFIGLTLAVSIL